MIRATNTQDANALSEIREVVSSLLWGTGVTLAACPAALVLLTCNG